MLTSVTGYISALQEQRLRLATDQGSTLLLTVGNRARVGYGRLRLLYAASAHVIVEYSGEPNLTSGEIHSIRRVKQIPPFPPVELNR